MEINYPSTQLNEQLYKLNKDFDTIDYNHPRGHFYEFSFSKNEIFHPLEKTKLFYLLKSKPQQYDGFNIDLNSIKNWGDYVFIYNQMKIHGFTTYFDYNDQFYCYYNGKQDSLYRKNLFKNKKEEKIIGWKCEVIKCGHRSHVKELSFQEKFLQSIQPHITYWYFWLLYFITFFFSIKKLKNYHKSF